MTAATEHRDWTDERACNNSGVDFYPDARDHAGVEAAMALCKACPVRDLCLADALSRPGEEGIWGGTTKRQRKAIIRARGGRPLEPRAPYVPPRVDAVSHGMGIGHTTAVPVPTKASPIRPVQRRNTSPFTSSAPTAPDPDALERIRKLRAAGHKPARVDGRRKDFDVAAAAAAYEHGASLADLENRFGVSHQTIRNRLAERGVAIRRRHSTREVTLDVGAAAKAYEAGATVEEVAARFGVSTATANRRLKAHGVQLRDRSSARRVKATPPSKAHPQETVDAVLAAYRAGTRIAHISAAHGIPTNTIYRWLDKAGITDRSGPTLNGDGTGKLRDLMASHGIASRDVRAWALETGRPVTARGIPPQTLVEAYIDEHATTERRATA